LKNRRDAVNKGLRPVFEGMVMKGMEKGLQSRRLMDMANGQIKNFITRFSGADSLVGEKRAFPDFASSSFSKQWKKNKKH
jgi:L-lactate dehydrogenase complex protein LldF